MTTKTTRQGDLLRTLRLFRGMNQKQLAKEVHASQTAISFAESGERALPASLVSAVAEKLGVDPTLLVDGLDLTPPPVCHFRKKARTPLWVRNHGQSNISLVRYVIEYLEQWVQFPEPDFPALSQTEPAEAASLCRERWGLGKSAPIDSTVRAIENAGGVILSMRSPTQDIDALSDATWKRPIFGINVAKSSSATRLRMSLAHEIGHCVLDGARESNCDEAAEFASEFLLPRQALHRLFPAFKGRIPWDQLFEIKDEWKVSLKSICFRAYKLGLMDQATYRHCNIELSGREESREPDMEQPEIFPDAIAILSAKRRTHNQMLDDLGWSADLFESVTGMKVPVRSADLPPGVIPLRPS